jgi:hypothetical protein
MAKLSEDQLARKDLLDAVRTVARLKSRIELRRTLNEVEAEILGEFDRRVASGKPFTPDLGALIKGEL